MLNISKAINPLSHVSRILRRKSAWDFALRISCHRMRSRRYYNRRRVPLFPLDIYLELTNHCNLNCLMCARRDMKRPKGFMEFLTLKNVIDQIPKDWKSLVRLQDWGESLLHPEFLKMAAHARRKAWLLELVTNGQLLKEEMAEGVLEIGFDRLVVSIDGATKETYEKVRRGGSYDVILNNMANFMNLRKRLRKNKPLIQISTIVMEDTREEIKAFSKTWEDYCDVVRITPVTLASYQSPFNNETESIPRMRNVPCQKLWTEMSVLWNGDITVCCGDFEGRLILGNAGKNLLQDLWHGRAWNNLRDIHKSRNFSSLPACANCLSERSIWMGTVPDLQTKGNEVVESGLSP